MRTTCNRREFLRQVTVGTAAANLTGLSAAAEKKLPQAVEHSLTVIAGKPRERGRQYGQKFKDAIHTFLDREIYQSFAKTYARPEQLRYAVACGKSIKDFSPVVMEELEGTAEGSGLKVEELVLLSLHEEFQHRGALPKVEHCTAIAAGPPATKDGNTYVGQTWDWMPSVYGLSSMLLWKRPEGPSLLAYSYPGLWAGAGMNSAGLALCWTSAGTGKNPAVGIPSYALLTHLLYQEDLKAAAREAKRNKQAGWFTFVMADDKGKLLNIEGAPGEVAVELAEGPLARVGYGSRQMTRVAAGQPAKLHRRARLVQDLLTGARGKLDAGGLKGMLANHDGPDKVCRHGGTLDGMLFNCTQREAYVTRGPVCTGRWKTFTFAEK